MKLLPEHAESYRTPGEVPAIRAEFVTEEEYQRAKTKTAELHEALSEEPTMDLRRTRAYMKKLMDRPASEIVEEIQSQVAIIILLANEQIIRFLERLDSKEIGYAEKRELQEHITALRMHSGELAKSKQSLVQVIGYDISELQTDDKGNVVGLKGQTVKMSAENFAETFGAELNPFVQK